MSIAHHRTPGARAVCPSPLLAEGQLGSVSLAPPFCIPCSACQAPRGDPSQLSTDWSPIALAHLAPPPAEAGWERPAPPPAGHQTTTPARPRLSSGSGAQAAAAAGLRLWCPGAPRPASRCRRAAAAPGLRQLQRGVHALAACQEGGKRIHKQWMQFERLQRPPGCEGGGRHWCGGAPWGSVNTTPRPGPDWAPFFRRQACCSPVPAYPVPCRARAAACWREAAGLRPGSGGNACAATRRCVRAWQRHLVLLQHLRIHVRPAAAVLKRRPRQPARKARTAGSHAYACHQP